MFLPLVFSTLALANPDGGRLIHLWQVCMLPSVHASYIVIVFVIVFVIEDCLESPDNDCCFIFSFSFAKVFGSKYYLLVESVIIIYY